MMIVRKLKKPELRRLREMCAICFEYPDDVPQKGEAWEKELEKPPLTREQKHWDLHWGAFEDNDKTLMSGLAVIPYPVHFDGGHCTMMGIGGVVTLPPYRRHGGIRGCFEAALPDMYEYGAVFSYLYPFSTAYYRKFGYELGCERRRYKLLISLLPKGKAEGTCHLVEEGSGLMEDIRKVYKVWQEKYNMMVVGEEFEFGWVEKANPPKDQEFTYVYRSVNGEPKGYMSLCKVDEPDGRNLRANRFFFTDGEGLSGLLHLVISLAADHRYVTVDLPQQPDLQTLLPEWSMGASQCQSIPWGMVRVVNVKKALEMARTCGDGNVVVEITDAQIAQNNGRFLVACRDGRVESVTLTEQAPDCSMGIADFSRLVLGVYGVDALEWMAGVTVFSEPEKLAKLFFRKPVMITENF